MYPSRSARRTSPGRSGDSSTRSSRAGRPSSPVATRSSRRSTGPSRAQAERWLGAAVDRPQPAAVRSRKSSSTRYKIGKGDRAWINALRGKDLHNASLVTIDYKTGDVLAYSGSAAYYRDAMASRKFDPKYDVAGAGGPPAGIGLEADRLRDGLRQPRPDARAASCSTSRPSSIAARTGRRATPTSSTAGPVLVRRALQYSLNIPAIRALERVGNEAVADKAEALGIRFTGGREAFLQSGLAGAIGTVEVRPLDLTSAYGALANEGYRVPPRMILEVRDPSGAIVYKAPDPTAPRTISAEAAYLVTDILAGNTDPKQNPIWADEARDPQRAERRASAGRGRRPGRPTTPATSRRTATSRRRPIRRRRASSSASGWATATTRCRTRRSPRPR